MAIKNASDTLQTRRQHLGLLAASALAVGNAHAQGSIKIGVTIPITGQQASSGREVDAAVKLWLAQSGAKAGGNKVEIIVKADAGIPRQRPAHCARICGHRQGGGVGC